MIRYTDGVKQFGEGMNESWDSWLHPAAVWLDNMNIDDRQSINQSIKQSINQFI